MDVALTSSYVTDIKHFNCFIFICPEVAFNFLGFLKKYFLSFEQSDHFFMSRSHVRNPLLLLSIYIK